MRRKGLSVRLLGLINHLWFEKGLKYSFSRKDVEEYGLSNANEYIKFLKDLGLITVERSLEDARVKVYYWNVDDDDIEKLCKLYRLIVEVTTLEWDIEGLIDSLSDNVRKLILNTKLMKRRLS